jgi:hypothetical protein
MKNLKFVRALLTCHTAKSVGLLALTFTTFAAVAQTCVPPANKDWTGWLTAQEDAGGHAKACHLGVSVSGLIGRLENRGGSKAPACAPYGEAASSWSDPASLLAAIKPAIIADAAGYAAGAAGTHVIQGVSDKTVGIVVTRFEGSNPAKNRAACDGNNSYVCMKTKTWTAVVRKTEAGACYLVTAYPGD